MRGRILISMTIVVVTICMIPSSVKAGFAFAQPEINLVEETHRPAVQSDVRTAFDSVGNVHAVWTDTRDSLYKIYGNTVLQNRALLTSYLVYEGSISVEYISPCIMSTVADPEHVRVMGASETVPPFLVLADCDLTTLPAYIDPTDVSEYEVIAATGIYDLETFRWGYNQNFVFTDSGNLFYGYYDGLMMNWHLSGVMTPGPNEVYSSPRLDADQDGFIYMSFCLLNSASGQCQLLARRSVDPFILAGGFTTTDRFIDSTFWSSPYSHAIAVNGYAGNLRVTVVYADPLATMPPTYVKTDTNGNWFSADPFNGPRTQANIGGGFSITDLDCGYDEAGRLYVVWNDNRTIGHRDIYGSVSYDFGLTFELNRLLVNNNTTTMDGPDLALGFTPGQIAVSYARVVDGFQDPYVLFSSPEFYDSCDSPPNVFWDGFSGVAMDTSLFHGQTGAGTSYRLETESVKGMLVRNYGIVEQQGVVELYFYDPLTPMPGASDFYIVLNNDNLKGVIRMLGVRNDTTQSNYSYYNGSQWIDWGGVRTAGWHHVILTVNDDGIMMQLEHTTGNYLTWSDTGLTSFTSLEIEGGSDSDPFHVDDILLEVTALPVSPTEIPVDGLVPILIGLIVTGVLVVRSRF